MTFCKDCKYLMFSDCYGECSKAYKGIVNADDYCEHGEEKDNGDDKRTEIRRGKARLGTP